MVQRHQITTFYTAPTAIRSLMQHSSNIPKKYDLSSLKVLGSVGGAFPVLVKRKMPVPTTLTGVASSTFCRRTKPEPINPEAWRWYYENVGGEKCTVVDTYWQTGNHTCMQLFGDLMTRRSC